MSWIQKLYETYDNCQSYIGRSGDEEGRPLLPICHITAQAKVEIVLNNNGEFRRAKIIFDQKKDATTIIPCTQESGGKVGSKPASHPLCDKLQYVASDFYLYGGNVTSGFQSDPEEPHREYIKMLTGWCESPHVHPKAMAVLNYVKRKTVINDLVEQNLLILNNGGKLAAKGDVKREKNSLDVFSIVNSQDDVFVRWAVESYGELESYVWKDKSLWESWINYYLSTTKEKSLCFVTGDETAISRNHPKYLRSKGDGAKLISSNDTSGFTFRGRFITDQQACTVGLEVSQKAHNALIWLINRQGKVYYVKDENGRLSPGLSIVAWATGDTKIPQPTDSTLDFLGLGDIPTDGDNIPYTAQNFAVKLRKMLQGYKQVLENTPSIQIMAVNSASKGRLAVTYYQEMDVSDYLERINKWHSEGAWRIIYQEKDDLGKLKKWGKIKTYHGVPTPINIAHACYGNEANEKIKQTTIARILPCILNGQSIPQDIVDIVVWRTSNRIGKMTRDDKQEIGWNCILSVACSLYAKVNNKMEEFSMSLDETRKNRDYLYGRLLAIADCLEERALYKAHEKRPTNAARYMQQFSQRPYRTWQQIHFALTPYIIRLGENASFYLEPISHVMCSFESPEEFSRNTPLTGEYLLGYYCQREKLSPKLKNILHSKQDEGIQNNDENEDDLNVENDKENDNDLEE